MSVILTSFYDVTQKILTKKKGYFQISVDFNFTIIGYGWLIYVHWHCSIGYCVKLHYKFPHVVTMLWQGSHDVVTILSPTSGTSGRLQNSVFQTFIFKETESNHSPLLSLIFS